MVGAMFVFTACNWIFPGGDEAATAEVEKTNDNFPRCQVERGRCLTDHSCCMDARGYPTEAAEAEAADGYDAYDEYEDAYEDVMNEYEDAYEDAMDEYEDAYEDAMDEYEDAYEDAMDEYEDLMNDYY